MNHKNNFILKFSKWTNGIHELRARYWLVWQILQIISLKEISHVTKTTGTKLIKFKHMITLKNLIYCHKYLNFVHNKNAKLQLAFSSPKFMLVIIWFINFNLINLVSVVLVTWLISFNEVICKICHTGQYLGLGGINTLGSFLE